ncbi:Tyrosine recombinase XerC [[Actinomadura] parvosata subsp. kistnae]|nr:Tyrosine recombinase XerC [Actinomadura parvosata subsp. kistnae]
MDREEVVREFERYLRLERDLSPHTVRAYLTDVNSLLDHTGGDVEGLDIGVLREWLAGQHAAGKARATLARRTACARTFTAYCHRRGWLQTDSGLLLGSAKSPRTLPSVLDQRQAEAVLEAPATGDPKELRDQALLELLYATGVRVSELCALDVDDVDRERNIIRVLGKGRKERSVPFGVPALRALDRWCIHGRPLWMRAGSGPALFLGYGVVASMRGPCGGSCMRGWPRWKGHRTWGRMGYGTARRRICSKVGPIFVVFRSFSGMRL